MKEENIALTKIYSPSFLMEFHEALIFYDSESHLKDSWMLPRLEIVKVPCLLTYSMIGVAQLKKH